LVYSSNNVVSNNLLLNNGNYGFNIIGSNNNLFFANTVSGSGYMGLSISSFSNMNSFYHNNFHDSVQVFQGPANDWSIGGEGNFWVGYNFTEADLDSDGIGDRPYLIAETNQDNYPLMGAFADFRVNFQERTHHVAFISNSSISDFEFDVGRETGNKILSFIADSLDGSVSFCRMTLPTSLMNYPFFVLDRDGEITANLLSPSNSTMASLYFTFEDGRQTITVISSKTAQLFAELFDNYSKLQGEFDLMNTTYTTLLTNLTASIQAMINNFSQLQNDFAALNRTLNENLANQSGNTQNLHNLSYILIAMTGAFLATTVYLTNRLHANNKQRNISVDEEQ
jgi:parallel beta-helix repeat protein